MVRTIGVVLVGLGVFLAALTPLLRYYAYPNLAVLPTDYYTISHAHAVNATYFDASSREVVRDVELTVTQTIKGQPEAGTGEVAVWETFSMITAPGGGKVGYSAQRVALDRRSGKAVNCCNDYVGTNKKAEHEGLVFKWPFFTKKKSYPYWDPTLLRAPPAEYEGTTTIRGLTVYKFVQRIESTRVGTQKVPGKLVGKPDDPTVEADRMYRNYKTIYVEPTSGSPVQIVQDRRTTLRAPDGSGELVTIDARIVLTDKQVGKLVAQAEDQRLKLTMLRNIVPLVCLGLGGLLIVVGLVLRLLLGRGRRHSPGRRNHQTRPQPAPH